MVPLSVVPKPFLSRSYYELRGSAWDSLAWKDREPGGRFRSHEARRSLLECNRGRGVDSVTARRKQNNPCYALQTAARLRGLSKLGSDAPVRGGRTRSWSEEEEHGDIAHP
jgi:hypothetical protein